MSRRLPDMIQGQSGGQVNLKPKPFHTCEVVDRAEADAKLANLLLLILLLTDPGTTDSLPIILGKHGIVVDI